MLTDDEKRTLASIRELVEWKRARNRWEAGGYVGPEPMPARFLGQTADLVEAQRAWLLNLVDRLLREGEVRCQRPT